MEQKPAFNTMQQHQNLYTKIKDQQRRSWGSGDYGHIGTTLQITGEMLCETMDLRSGESVLDVAAGNGNATLAAARRFCRVISTDYISKLLDESKVRAQADDLLNYISYQVADAENLPFDDSSFDNIISTFGVMFTPDQHQSVNELLRVCRTNGKIGLANWTPQSFIGQLFNIISQYRKPIADLDPPMNWGTRAFVDEYFTPFVKNVHTFKRVFNFRYPSAAHWIEYFKTYYGPVNTTFATLDQEQGLQLEKDILLLIKKFNTADDQTIVVPSEYMEVVIIK